MMKFLVFIKQVPGSADIRFDPQRKTIIREGVKNEINAYDRRAITEAIRYRNENGGEVVVATMGPGQARDALKEALLMGADSCIHIHDSQLAGSDTLVTARVLAAVAQKVGYDVIFCGQHSTDSETGQVPVELAELLGIPSATAVRKIEYLPGRRVQVTSETEEGSVLLEMSLPAVITTAERLIKPLKTKNADLRSVPGEKIIEMRLQDLGISPEEVGFKGSPTRVDDITDVSITRSPQVWDGSDISAIANRIVDLMRTEKKPAKGKIPARDSNATALGHQVGVERLFWVWIEFLQGQIRPVSFEMLSTAAALAAENGGSVFAITTNDLTPQRSTQLASYGADKIIHISGVQPHPDQIVSLLSGRIQTEKPFALFFPASSQGKYLAPRIAARLGLGLTGDCVGLSFGDANELAHLKPAFGGNIVAPIYSRTYPQMATIRPGALSSPMTRETGSVDVIEWVLPEVQQQFTIIAQEIDPGIEAARLDHAKTVVGIGVGLGQENLSLAYQLADLLGGSVGATRKVVDNGWIPRQFQIGLTGKFIAPDVYLGLGVSGRYNHMIGVQKAKLIIAINHDPTAEVFGMADIGIHGDCIRIASELIRILQDSKER